MKKIFIVFYLLLNSLLISAEDIHISAAASLKEFMEKNIREYNKIYPNIHIHLNTGGSGTLKRQIEQGADVDIVFLANQEYINILKKENLIYNSEIILKNRLALIKNKKVKNNQTKYSLAIGNPNYVPAGKYAEESLKKSPLNFKYNKILAKDVRAVLNYVELGEADYGIVYLSDTKYLKNSILVSIFPDNTHTPIVYPIAIVKDTTHIKTCNNFIKFLRGKKWN